MRSAPARLIAVSDSSAAARSSSHPARAAALTIAYSPETLYAASGAWNASRAARITSRYGNAGLIMIASAPSARSILHSRSASRRSEERRVGKERSERSPQQPPTEGPSPADHYRRTGAHGAPPAT